MPNVSLRGNVYYHYHIRPEVVQATLERFKIETNPESLRVEFAENYFWLGLGWNPFYQN